MENANQAPPAVIGVRREPSIDPVKAQGILKSVTQKEKHAARLWQQRWGFLSRIREVQEEEAQRIGMSLNEYRAAVRSVSCKPEKEISVDIDPSPTPLPRTSAGIIGRRAKCGLERFGPQVKTVRDYPIHPPLPRDQIYDPYKQTMIFLGSVEGDPISYKLPPTQREVFDEMWAQPQQLCISSFPLHRVYD
ncbi:uncharacterized protein LOC112043165 [Bicyclus anynana]|uniref:Uncharacterized protein LOC112043165 n=1 Tax=Bicyclus anynana TaxID=110368 RepID=A0A6J1MGE8_BICAN|nr:uncharacterized protein LOC112043165 [Bicyclus anynana]